MGADVKKLVGQFMRTRTIPLVWKADPPEEAENVNPDVDLFFEYGRTAVADDKEIHAPELKGTSGGSVWEYVDLDGGLWAPEKVAKVVGVQSARLRGKYFRAVSWGVVASILGQMDPDLKEAVMQILVIT